jgi:hypothetical protein
MVDMRNVKRISVKTPEVKKPPGRSRYGRIILKWILKKQGMRVSIGFIWLRTGNGGRFLYFRFHKEQGIS